MIRILLSVTLFVLAIPKKLLMIQSTFRHGARYPIYVESTDYSDIAREEKSIGELTSEGKNMHYLLGQIIYDKYWE